MDAKSKAEFINSVAGNQKIPCPNCGMVNEPGSRFCQSCGGKLPDLTAESEPKGTEDKNMAFATIQENGNTAVRPKSPLISQPPVMEVYVEEDGVFAKGLPEWDVLPPQAAVRRKVKK